MGVDKSVLVRAVPKPVLAARVSEHFMLLMSSMAAINLCLALAIICFITDSALSTVDIIYIELSPTHRLSDASVQKRFDLLEGLLFF